MAVRLQYIWNFKYDYTTQVIYIPYTILILSTFDKPLSCLTGSIFAKNAHTNVESVILATNSAFFAAIDMS